MEHYGPLSEDWLCEDVRQIIRNYMMPPPPPTPLVQARYVASVCSYCSLQQAYHWIGESQTSLCFCNYCPDCDCLKTVIDSDLGETGCSSCYHINWLPSWHCEMVPAFIKK
jgi:hypothetical protein